MHTKFYFAIFITMKNQKEKKQQIVNEPQVALNDADLMAFIEDSQQVDFYNEQLDIYMSTL